MDRKLRMNGRTYSNTMWSIITSSPIYGKAGRTLLFGAYFLESKNTKKEVLIQQITLANPRQQHLDMTYSSTAANFEQWKKHQLAPFYVLRTLIGLNLWWLLTIVGLKIKARIQLKQ